MKKRTQMILGIAAAVSAMTVPGMARADDAERQIFSFSGFGTLGMTHSDNRNADFSATPLQPNGAGYTHSWSADVDSKLGFQVNANFTDRLSGVLQLVSKQRYDNSYIPTVEWANLSYQITPDLKVRVGRSVWPLLLKSETQFVGYGNPNVRNSSEALANMPNTSLVGVDVSYNFNVGVATNTIQPLYGSNTVYYPGNLRLNVDGIAGVSDTLEFGDTKVHAAYMKMKYTLEAFGLINIPYTTWSAGVNYDPGEWYASAELMKSTDDLYGRSTTLMLGAGYRIGDWTPYISRTSQTVDYFGTAGDLGTGTNVGDAQVVNSIGVRWDFRRNMDFKLQYEQISSGSIARMFPISLVNLQPGFTAQQQVKAVSAVVDFVF